MTEAEFIEALEATGLTDVKVRHDTANWGQHHCITVQFRRNGKKIRQGVTLTAPEVSDARGFDALLDWALNPV